MSIPMERSKETLADSSHVEPVLACTVRMRKRVLEWLQASGEERGQNLQESDRGTEEEPTDVQEDPLSVRENTFTSPQCSTIGRGL